MLGKPVGVGGALASALFGGVGTGLDVDGLRDDDPLGDGAGLAADGVALGLAGAGETPATGAWPKPPLSARNTAPTASTTRRAAASASTSGVRDRRAGTEPAAGDNAAAEPAVGENAGTDAIGENAGAP